jgi:hypothetical protein
MRFRRRIPAAPFIVFPAPFFDLRVNERGSDLHLERILKPMRQSTKAERTALS